MNPKDLKTYLDEVPMTTPEMIARVATANQRIEIEELREELLSTRTALIESAKLLERALDYIHDTSDGIKCYNGSDIKKFLNTEIIKNVLLSSTQPAKTYEELREKLFATQRALDAVYNGGLDLYVRYDGPSVRQWSKIVKEHKVALTDARLTAAKICGKCAHYYNDDLCGQQVPPDTEAPQCFTQLKADNKETTT